MSENEVTDLMPVNEIETDIQTIQSAAFTPPDEMPDLEGAEVGISLAPAYREFEQEGETVRAIFCGFSSMNSKQGGTKPLAIFQTRDGVFVNAGDNLVRQVKAIPPRTPVQITYTGKQKTQSGNNVKTFDVRLLKIVSKAGAQPANGQGEPPTELKATASETVSRDAALKAWQITWNEAQKLGLIKRHNITAVTPKDDAAHILAHTAEVRKLIVAEQAKPF